MAENGSITIVGLGPAGGELLTRQAWEALAAAERIYLRTARHPAVDDLPAHVTRESFDPIYDSAPDFAAVYKEIVERLLALARRPQEVVYAVPGHPFVAEATVPAVLAAARAEDIPVRVIPGLSFVEPALTALGVDALDGLQLYDAIAIAAHRYPPLNPDTPALLGQLYNRPLANELKLSLMAIYPDEHEVALIHAAGGALEQVERLPLYAVDRSDHIGHLTALYLPPLPAPGSLEALAEAVAVLRGPDGCPWDQEQTPQSLRAGLLEETAEVLDALDAANPEALEEELGDLLLHIVMQAQMASEEERFRLSDVLAGIWTKIRRRHPHVWGEWQAEGAAEVVANWEAIKRQEKADAAAADDAAGHRPSLLDDVPQALPSLARARKIQDRVRKVGFDWPQIAGVVAKVQEEIAELQAAAEDEAQMAEMGDIFFALVNWARWLDIDPEAALREANQRFEARFRRLEKLAAERQIALDEASIDELEALWQEVKLQIMVERRSSWAG